MRGTRPAFSVGEIVRATVGSLEVGKTDTQAFGVSTDSRTVEAGNLFVALRGDRFDGHDFLAKAAEKKAAGFVVKAGTRLAGAACGGEDLFVVAVADTLRALGDLARHWRDHFKLPVIAVTGSSGKTTTKDMIGAVLSRGRKSLVSPGNWNNLVGVPKALFGIREDHEAAVIEMGTNRMGEIGRLAEIARPTVGVITTIGRAHLEGFGTLDRVAEEKGSLFRGMDPAGTIVVNEDDARILKAAAPWGGKRITFGVHGQADVGAEDMVIDSTGGTRFTLRVGSFRGSLFLPFFGRSNVGNALAAAAACRAAGLDPREILEGLGEARPVPGRLTVSGLAGGAFLVDDTYNANPDSLRAALAALEDVRGGGRLYLLLGDMLELGEEAGTLHREAGREIGKLGVESLLLAGTLAEWTAAGAEEAGTGREKVVFVTEPAEAVSFFRGRLRKGDWILVKGSRGMRMESFCEALRSAFGRPREEERERVGEQA